MKNAYVPSITARIIALFIGIIFLYSSCSFEFDSVGEKQQSTQEQIVNQIQTLDKEELYESLRKFKAENPEIALSEADEQKLDLFLNDPQKALELIVQEENGETIIKLIGTMFNEGTIDEAVQALEVLAPETANEFVGFLDEIAEALNMENEPVTITEARTISASQNTRPNIRNFPVILTKQMAQQAMSRNVLFYSEDLTWGNVAWYAGFCVATTLGAYASSCLIPWVKIAGIVAFVAGGASMAAQMYAWKDSSDLLEFGEKLYKGVKDVDVDKLNAAVNILITSPETSQILTIGSLTLATIAACYKSPFGTAVVTGVKTIYQSILDFIGRMLPDGINWTIQGIKIPNASSPSIPPAPIPIPTIPSAPSKKKPVWWNPFTWF